MALMTADELTALRAAIATGTQSVRYADRTVTYRSLAEMLALADRAARELASTQRASVAYVDYRRDLP